MSFVSMSLKSLPVRFGAACMSMAALLGAPMARAMVPPSERAVLDAIWYGTGGQLPGGTDSTWINRGGWGLPVFLGISECGSYGVTCVVDQGQEHVSAIHLADNGLTGQLPPSLSALPYLESFSVNGNAIGGSIPTLSGLTRMAYFNIEGNQFAGEIPALTGLNSLTYFVVDANQLSGTIPSLAGLTDLQYFMIHDNQLSGSIPSLTGLVNLQYFVAFANQLTGALPAVAGMTYLSYFDVGYNKLTGPIPSLSGLSNLYWFSVRNNELTGPIPDLSDLVSFDLVLDVSSNRLTGQIPAAPVNLSQAFLCPNLLTITSQPMIDPAWNAATGAAPWWATPFANNRCDDLMYGDFEWYGPT